MSNIFDDVADGLINLDEEVFTEAVNSTSIPYTRVVSKIVSAPRGESIGRGELCFLYSHNFNETKEYLKRKDNFIDQNHKYHLYYYNRYYQGRLNGRVYRIYDNELRKSYYKDLKNDRNINIITLRTLNTSDRDNRNMYYDLFRYNEIFENICNKLQILKYIGAYWSYYKNIYNMNIPGYNHKYVLVDLKYQQPLTNRIKDNLKNPLFIIYYTLYRAPELLSGLNLDFFFYNGRRVLKINPSLIKDKKDLTSLRIEMKKIMKGITDEITVDKATNTDELEKDEIANTAAHQVLDKVITTDENDDTLVIKNTEELKKVSKVSNLEKEVENKAVEKVKKATNTVKKDTEEKPSVPNTSNTINTSNNKPKNDDIASIINSEKKEKESKAKEIDNKVNLTNNINNEIRKDLDSDKALIDKIYRENQAKSIKPQTSLSSARDKMLRENEKNLKVGNMTIADIEKEDVNKIKIPVTDVSKNVKTTNENMKDIRFDNVDKTYIHKVMNKDIVNAFMSLNDKSIPMYIRDIKVEDTSDELNYKDTYTVYFEDANRKRHTVKVDIPKFVDDKFLYLGGNKKLIKHQNFYYPVVKLAPDMVQIVTNYSKMTVERVENKSISPVERLKKLIMADKDLQNYFTIGSAFISNKGYITTLEYDDLSRSFTKFTKDDNTFFFFNQEAADNYMKGHKPIIPEKENYMFIGMQDNKPVYININSQTDDNDKDICDLIIENLPEEYKVQYESTRSPKRLMYAKVRIMKQNVSVGMLICFWEGISNVLKKLKCEYRLEDKVPSSLKPDEEFIKFSDCVLIYKANVPNSLVLNGIRMYNTQKYKLSDFDTKLPYVDYIKKVYGTTIVENALMNFYEFAVDPITKEICNTLNLPNDIVGLFIYTCNILSDSQFKNDISQNLMRVRCAEIIPAILYERLSKNYVDYRNYGGRKKFNVPQDCVIKEILNQKTVSDYSTLNPFLEMDELHGISAKGFRGVNLEDAYTIEKRGFDPSMIGVMGPSSSPDGQVGVNRTLTLEPAVTNVRGFVEDKFEEGKEKELKDVNLFSPCELSIPLGATIDDPTRLGHANKQSRHVIPVKDSSPVLISNGFEEVSRFHLSEDFVVNAEEDGEIVDYDEKSKIMIAKYKSGKCKAIDLSPTIVKNSGGGFFLSNVLVTNLKVGDKFKKNDVLAYHKDFFKNDEFNDCRMVMGTLTKVAIMSTYNTYEDSTVITQSLSERCATEMCFQKQTVVGKNSNVFYMVHKGDEISVGDPLIKFDTSYEDNSVNELLANLSKDEKKDIMEEARNEVKSKYSGVIEDIKIYSTVDLDDMSPSLRKIVSDYYKTINEKKSFLSKYDDPNNKEKTVKCGMMITEATHKVNPNKFGVIKGEHVEDSVLIEFYIKHSEPLEIGSKIANFTALKNTVGEIIPKGYEPFSSYRPDEEVSTFIASNSILNRMTPSILLTALGNKCIIELKRHLKDLNMDRAKMEKMIYDFFSAIDKSGTNTKKYKALFEPMSDAKFKKWFSDFFKDDYAYLVLDIVDYEHSVSLKDIEAGAKVLNVPLWEYVTLPHLTMDKEHAIVTKVPVPVGYINEKRTQQTVMKKNGISTDIAQRSALTNQVTGNDKNGRESDVENTMLTVLGLKNTLKELNGPRADDTVMKQQMLRDIALNGYTRLSDMTDNVENKTTLNTVDTYLRGMTLESDLVVKGLMLPKELHKEL